MEEILVKDKDGKDIKLFYDYEEWMYLNDWYQWKELYFRFDEKTLPLEHQFKQWRQRVKNR